MAEERRKFRREGEERRRDALISAALELIAEGGPGVATVRAIADRAGVTPGLIRHYFSSKEELTREAYRALMERMSSDNAAVLDRAADPRARLAAFVAAALRPPVMDAARMGLWAGFIHQVRRDAAMAAVHAETYLAYRDRLQALIAALPGTGDAARQRALAIACNGVIDGLWLEGSALPEAFAAGELERIGLDAVGAILGLDLPAPSEQTEDRP
ncbi:transcriptional regulator, TetR family [Gemmobacter aquatilis]|uniref:Transcriptional regulator, TetR family n=1 Tax=Gemmobacter aquatilis TaxID=933059 RepID=A0A1H8M3P9_9RHOB|nr:TetR family transcriptional regulator C-terminal domain-containing protein [Gemmobacter aquatilis]SEO11959.1 transcriptional regulator, TetR family [Gemmobacter aquatilis]